MKKNSKRQGQAASRGKLPNFAVGDYVMVARVRRPDSTPKLVSTSLAKPGGRLCDDGKGTAAGLNAEVGEHVDRSFAKLL